MSLSSRTKDIVEVALADRKAADELTAAIDAGGNAQAAVVTAITSSNLVGVDGTGSNAAPLVETEARLDAIESKINAILTSLKNAGLMAS